MTYLFLTIAIGLGLGADQRIITTVAFILISLVIWISNQGYKRQDNQNLLLTITTTKVKKFDLNKIVNILKKHCPSINLRRYDKNDKFIETVFVADFEEFVDLTSLTDSLSKFDKKIKISFLDNKGVY